MTLSVSAKCVELRKNVDNVRRLHPSGSVTAEIDKIDKIVIEIEEIISHETVQQESRMSPFEDEIKEKYKELEDRMNNRMSVLEEENTLLRNRTSTLEKDNTLLRNRTSTLEKDNTLLRKRVEKLEDDTEAAKLSRVFSEKENAAIYIGEAFADVYRQFSAEVNNDPVPNRVYRNLPQEWITSQDAKVTERWQHVKKMYGWNTQLEEVAQEFFDYRTRQPQIFIRKLEHYVHISTLQDLSPDHQFSLLRLVEVLKQLS